MVYGSETWPVKVEDVRRLERTERTMVRWMCGVRLQDRCSSDQLLQRLSIEGVEEVMRRGRLRWLGHVERKDPKDWVSACRDIRVGGRVGKGRGRKTWNEVVENDMKKRGLRREMAMDREYWRSHIVGNRPTRACMEKRTLRR